MGFLSGFAGGATLVLSVSYLVVHANQSSRASQSLSLRSSAHALSSRNLTAAGAGALLPPPPPRHAAESLPIQSLKDRWNVELSAAARRVQHLDWNAARDSAEAAIMRLWHGQDWKPEYSPEAWAQAEKAHRAATTTSSAADPKKKPAQ